MNARWPLAGVLGIAGMALFASTVSATTPVPGVTTSILVKSTVAPLNINSHPDSATLWGARLKTHGITDAYVVDNKFAVGSDTGWHSHPGPVLVQVVSGAVTLRHAAHGRCLSEVVRAGHGFFEAPGAVHNAANQRLQPAVVYATFVLPPGAPPEVSAPIPPACH